MTRALVSREDLEAARHAGLYLAEAARELGVDPVSVARAEKRHGLSLARADRDSLRYRNDYRAAVQDMRPIDAVEYLLEVIESLRMPVDHHWTMPGVHLTRSERQLLQALVDCGQRILTKDGAMRAIMFGREADDPPEPRIIDVLICRMRKKLSPLGIKITTHWGQGWTISAPVGSVWPWEAQE